MKPFIFPWASSATALTCPWGPPPLISEVSWYGLSHLPVIGSVAHSLGTPCDIGMPSAPGYVPK